MMREGKNHFAALRTISDSIFSMKNNKTDTSRNVLICMVRKIKQTATTAALLQLFYKQNTYFACIS